MSDDFLTFVFFMGFALGAVLGWYLSMNRHYRLGREDGTNFWCPKYREVLEQALDAEVKCLGLQAQLMQRSMENQR